MKDLNKKESSIRRIIRKAPNQRLAELCEGLPEDHGLNQDLVIPFMEAKGAYHIIAEILGMRYIGKGLFMHEETNRKYILDKYGFRPNTNYNYQVKYAEIKIELKKVRQELRNVMQENEGEELRNVRQENERLKKNLHNLKDQREKELANSRYKIHHQAITLKDFHKKIIEQREIIKLQKQENVELIRKLREFNCNNNFNNF